MQSRTSDQHQLPATSNRTYKNSDKHGKPRTIPHCRVLPPDKFNGIIHESLAVYSESFTTKVANVFL